MNVTTSSRDEALGTVVRALIALEAVAYIIASALHVGVQIPLGFAVLSEPPILPATIVEGLSGLFLAAAGFGVFLRRNWAWGAAVAAHAFAILGILVGITALAAGAAPSTDLNYVYHRVLLGALLVSLTLLLLPAGRAAVERRR